MAHTSKDSKAAAAAANSKPVMDVSHPNKSAPSPNSKSVIVPNRPIMKDPMVKEDASAEQPSQSKPVKIKVEPLSAPLLDTKSELKIIKSKADEDEEASNKPEPTKVVTTETKETEPDLEPTKETKPETKADAEPAPEEEIKHEIPEPKADPKNEEVQKEPEAVKDIEPEETEKTDEALSPGKAKPPTEPNKTTGNVDKLIESKKYFLPINSVEKRRSKRVVAFGILLSLLLIVAWIDIALDAGLIEINGIKPVTHFFST